MTYEEYLKTDHWRKKRTEAKDVFGWSCILCESGEDLQVHHRHYRTLGRELPAHDLGVLCGDHHKMYHDILPKPELYWLKKAMELFNG